MIRLCGMPGCNVLLLIAMGASDTNRCNAHQGQRAPAESDEQRMERVCRELGWKRARPR